MKILEGKTALITGGGRGIGRCIARAMADAGADLFLISRTEKELQETADLIAPSGRRVLTHRADVTQADAVHAAVTEAVGRLGRIDILVNNAGVQGPIGPLMEVSVDAWIKTIQVNLIGTFLMCRAVLPQMMARRQGKIINLSGGGATRPRPFFSAYGASKAAVVRLTETLAEELKPYRIQVNAVAPGAVLTQMTEEVLRAGEQAGPSALTEARQVQQKQVSADRAAGLAVFLASPASDGLTGRLISAIHDDWENLPGYLEEVMASDLFTLRRVDHALKRTS